MIVEHNNENREERKESLSPNQTPFFSHLSRQESASCRHFRIKKFNMHPKVVILPWHLEKPFSKHWQLLRYITVQ